MKKFFCFNCQTEVIPQKFIKWNFCPHCKHYIRVSDSGFYRVCDKCGANMPADATYCRKCRLLFDGSGKMKPLFPFDLYSSSQNGWNWLLNAITLFLAIIIGIGVIYISVYVIFAFIFIALVYWIFNLLRWR